MARPLCFKNKILMLTEILGHEQPSKVSLNHFPFSICVKYLFNCRNRWEVKVIISTLGSIIEVELDDPDLDTFRWVKFTLDVTKPLR